MIKGLLIYDSESAVCIYYNYSRMDIILDPDLLSSYLNAFRKLDVLDNIDFLQFSLGNNGSGLIIKDSLGFHNDIRFYDKDGYSGIFSVEEGASEEFASSIFNIIIDYLKIHYNKRSRLAISRPVRKTLDNFIELACGTQ